MTNKLNLPILGKNLVLNILFLSVFLGCSESTPPASTSTSTSVPTLTPTSIPSLTSKPFIGIREKLSPGTYVVYWSQGTWYIKGLDGSGNIQLMANISSEINTILELSSDENQVAFSNTAGNLVTYDLNISNLASYYNADVNSIYELEWLPDNNIILYLGTPEEIVPDSNVGLYGVSLESKKTFTLLDWSKESDKFKYGLHGITLSKDGTWLAFYAPRLSEMMAPDPDYAVYLMNTSCLQTPETCSESIQFVGDGTFPTWSLDGRLGWICSNEALSTLCVIDVNRSESQQVLFDISDIALSPEIRLSNFSWSPNGKYIAVNLVKSLETNIANDVASYVLITSSDGEQIIEVTSLSDGESRWEGWSPDSRYLIYSKFLSQTDPYGEIGVRSPITDLYLYDTQSETKIDFIEPFGDREVFSFFIHIK